MSTTIRGLRSSEIEEIRQHHGWNVLPTGTSYPWVRVLLENLKEPMFLMLVLASALYFILGSIAEGMMMVVALILIFAIAVYQGSRSSKAIEALQQYTAPGAVVIRDGVKKVIPSNELVPGDCIVLEEGGFIPADAVLLETADLMVNESLLTGESMPLEKSLAAPLNTIFQGTQIVSGKCVALVIATGSQTEMGKLGKLVSAYKVPQTLLQKQIRVFVTVLTIFGVLAFLTVWLLNFLHGESFLNSLLLGLTLAMASVPEEIPVAFASFMALGAYYMSKHGIISRQPQTIENLGAVSVICLDKTGTITTNQMKVAAVYEFATDHLYELKEDSVEAVANTVLAVAKLASEADPFDAMEKAILEAHQRSVVNLADTSLPIFKEYHLEGKPPMMTHVHQQGSSMIAASKGAVERILRISKLNEEDQKKVLHTADYFGKKGYRVLGVAHAVVVDKLLPEQQDDFNWVFSGLVALYDPPKPELPHIIRSFEKAHIEVLILTGDHAATTETIAGAIGLKKRGSIVTGDQVIAASDEEVDTFIHNSNLFVRMFPEAKLKIIEALKKDGQIVAMTGDGVNDGPALKSADIGIAMGSAGTAIARDAADLVITDDNLQRVIEAIYQGRKIFRNLKNAFRYIISIHIPIILTAAVPLLLGWKFPNIFTPIHVIFLELIMGPTCSIFFEKEPVANSIMMDLPRDRKYKGSAKQKEQLFTSSELTMSLLQGLVIASGALGIIYYYTGLQHDLVFVRSLVFIYLLLSNLLLTLVNRSFNESFITTLRYKNSLFFPIVLASLLVLTALLFIPGVQHLFEMTAVPFTTIAQLVCLAFLVVFWVEPVKMFVLKKGLPE